VTRPHYSMDATGWHDQARKRVAATPAPRPGTSTIDNPSGGDKVTKSNVTPDDLRQCIDDVLNRQELLAVECTTLGDATKWELTHDGDYAGSIVQTGLRCTERTGLGEPSIEPLFEEVCALVARRVACLVADRDSIEDEAL
jgi:hypothetical protein